MSLHQTRVVDEKGSLDDKIRKLRAFLKGEEFKKLDRAEQLRLLRQDCIMELYSEVLGERIAAFEPDAA